MCTCASFTSLLQFSKGSPAILLLHSCLHDIIGSRHSMLHILSAVQLYYFKTACFKTGLSDAVVFSWSSYIATGSYTNNHLRYVKNKLDMSVSAS